ncbi:hypothetical protein GCM10007301_04230 [Azorhizobium oxalatiphilum]|uniref:Methyltransferase type 11 domain-containing protein n=1 Tax=Azorhizobium oxalatiphilum TaxID=980631 RepID=A0A917BJN2_9HYPH|nr:hypothetical protein GCM10007301_04230 [Azorhizobium oxalatiphilum]
MFSPKQDKDANRDPMPAFWRAWGQQETIVRHRGEPRRDLFREHPVWLAVMPLLLDDAARPLRRVADMGSGTGIVAEHFARLGYEVVAIEAAESRAEIARRRLAPYPSARVVVGDALNPPLEVGEVDAIVSRNLMWLLPDPPAAVQGWRNLLAPGGRVAALDATWRLQRYRFSRFLPRKRGNTAPQTMTRPTPLSNTPTSEAAMQAWSQAGLEQVRAVELGWLSAVKDYRDPLRRMADRSRYYAVVGDVPA